MVMSEKLGLPEKSYVFYPICYINKNLLLRLYSGLPKKEIVFYFILDVEIKDIFCTYEFLSFCVHIC